MVLKIQERQEFPVAVSDKIDYRAEVMGSFQSSPLKCKKEHYKIVVPSTSEVLCVGALPNAWLIIWTTEKIYRKNEIQQTNNNLTEPMYLETGLRVYDLLKSKAVRSRKGWNV